MFQQHKYSEYFLLLWILICQTIFWADRVEISGEQKGEQDLVPRIWLCSRGMTRLILGLAAMPINENWLSWSYSMKNGIEQHDHRDLLTLTILHADPWRCLCIRDAKAAGQRPAGQGPGSTAVSDRRPLHPLLGRVAKVFLQIASAKGRRCFF